MTFHVLITSIVGVQIVIRNLGISTIYFLVM